MNRNSKVVPDSRSPTKASYGQLISHTRWALKQTWSTNASLTVGLVISSLARSLVPAGMALVSRGIINGVVDLVEGGVVDLGPLVFWLALSIGLGFLQAGGGLLEKYISLRLHDELNIKITTDILAHAARLELAFFEDPRFHDIMNRAQQSPARYFSHFVLSSLHAVTGIVQIASILVILITIEPILLLALVLVIPPYAYFQWHLARTRYDIQRSRITKQRWTRYFIRELTHRQSVPRIKLLDLAPLFVKRYHDLMSEFRDQDKKIYMRGLLGGGSFAVVLAAAFYATFIRVVFRALSGAVTLGDVAIFGGAAATLRNRFDSVVLSMSNAFEQMLYISNLLEFFAIEPRMIEQPGLRLHSCRGDIKVSNVTFAYPSSNKPAISNVSLHIKPGQTVALVGENGAGKTTLVKLITRLYDPSHGAITFDGIDLRELSLEEIHSHVSFVFQDFGRYEATVAENIAFGNWRKFMNDQKAIEKIARLAGVHDMIEAMPQKYDTFLGRMFGEHDLSGGHWQKIAITRALARDSSVLILDEPTSNLDARAEYEIYCRFRDLTRGKTTILISHRFSTVSMADRILVMDQGQIVEGGTHQELIAQHGHYANLYGLHMRQMTQSSSDREI